MTPRLRKFALLAHIIFSVGWLGAVVGFLVLAVAGLTSGNVETVRGAYVAMDLLGRYIVVPMSLAAIATGLVQALGTEWGLVRHYWVLAKFLLTLFAAIALLLHQFTAVAEAAKRARAGTSPDAGRLGIQLAGDAGVAVLLLLGITTLAVYKPWGLTRFGRRKQEKALPTRVGGLSVGLKIFLAVLGAIAVGFVVLHLAGGGLGRHGR